MPVGQSGVTSSTLSRSSEKDEETSQLVERRTLEAEQRARDAALAKEQAKLAAQRKQQANEALKTVREPERAAKEAVAELQQSLSSASSGSPSEASDE